MKICTVSQGFALNYNPLYKGEQLLGHTGVDECCGYGTPVYALKHGVVYKILDKDHPASDGSGYWAVFIISKDKNGQYCEWQIGHLSEITCAVGDTVTPATIIGKEGNRGKVYSGEFFITKAMQDAGDKRGSHRHWNKKVLERVHEKDRENYRGQWIFEFGGEMYKDIGNYFYAVKNFDNGFRGSVDPMQDLIDGYAEISKQITTPEEDKIIQEAVEITKRLSVFPMFKGASIRLIEVLISFLKGKLPK